MPPVSYYLLHSEPNSRRKFSYIAILQLAKCREHQEEWARMHPMPEEFEENGLRNHQKSRHQKSKSAALVPYLNDALAWILGEGVRQHKFTMT